jgi:hypothetical protein
LIVWLASYPRSGNTYFRVVLNRVFGIGAYTLYPDGKAPQSGAEKAYIGRPGTFSITQQAPSRPAANDMSSY